MSRAGSSVTMGADTTVGSDEDTKRGNISRVIRRLL